MRCFTGDPCRWAGRRHLRNGRPVYRGAGDQPSVSCRWAIPRSRFGAVRRLEPRERPPEPHLGVSLGSEGQDRGGINRRTNSVRLATCSFR